MHFTALVVSILPILAAAAAATAIIEPQELALRDGNCDTGSIQCCQSTQNATLTSLAELSGGVLGLSLPPIAGLVGLACSGIVGGTSCSVQPVCCTDNTFSGVIALGCTPLSKPGRCGFSCGRVKDNRVAWVK